MMSTPGSRRTFGTLPDGQEVEAVTIAAGGLSADILSWGAVLRDLRLHGAVHPLVLGFDGLDDYLKHSRFFGATAGRYANRIAEGRFELDGQSYQLERNFRGRHHLHGGSDSFGTRPWTIDTVSEASVTLGLDSPDGEGGYPGAIHVSCTFQIVAPATLRIVYQAETSAPTILNLAHHSYFNLDGSADITRHRLQIRAGRYLPVDETLIPTGEILPVEATPFDFRDLRRIRAEGGAQTLYDHNYCLSDEPAEGPLLCATLEGESGIGMRLSTTEPGVQFYDGSTLDVPVDGLDGRRYGAHAGFCLEPQRWPDSPNHSNFTDATLRPGETYHQVSLFEFSS